ncbi:type II toxin-antitoxin system RelE/ParE family toxin [Leptospira alstonii]|uniref:Plasmid stabilization system protein, RelE/ParE family n=2 Tax=Leptospira alstonii TaxID=28452 RepID=M6CTU0_9LEPT|nr:type II toxin-antitoxin system RelE/ParE family toxin [Leptospira alstonii]EMJ95134.1 plasmid stabilization system protein, RelE/ParE family [Leptospira alstonii serovar Sichuan str. 79601]EQA82216.1 plasmid stabilization system protein, RelE/ParE family [Leptospira alstonii serovar Pingchang str. 80-412]
MKLLPIRIKPAAEQDVIQAVDYYNRKKENLGFEFVLEIDSILDRASRFPEIGPYVYKDFRQLLTRRFPFRIFYKTSKHHIDVYAVLHQSREFRKLLQSPS